MGELRFDGKVVIVTGAGGGLGKQYALFYGSRGASVVVNDFGGPLDGGSGGSKGVAQQVADEITSKGGKAVADFHSVEDGDKIVETAVNAFGGVHIVVNSAGNLKPGLFKDMTLEDWQSIYRVHLYGVYRVLRAAWPYMRKQKFGRIVNTTSSVGLYGVETQSLYGAAKSGIIGLTETLAKEGAKYNITANAIGPLARSRMTEHQLPADMLPKLDPKYVVPLVAYLTHENTKETWGIYEAAGGGFAKLRWQRAKGALVRPDDTWTPSAVLKKFDQIEDFSEPQYGDKTNNYIGLIEQANKLPPNPQGEPVSFKDQVAIVTGGGNGLGRAYCKLLASLGAKVVVNDVVDPEPVVQEIKAAGGIAVGDKHSVVDGAKVVQTAIDNFGTVHAVINNAGIIRDKSFANMTEQQWNEIIAVHLTGTIEVTRAAWPYFIKQKYGRVVNTSSTSGIYGNFGQANYAAAKLAVLGFARTLAREGAEHNIIVNTIAPTAGTQMTSGVFTEEMLQSLKPDYVAPVPVLLVSNKAPVTGHLFEVGTGWAGRTRLQRSRGYGFSDRALSPEAVAEKWKEIVDFDNGQATYPNDYKESAEGLFLLKAGAESKL